MKKYALLVSILIVLLTSIAVYAAASGPVEHDTYVDGTGTNFDDSGFLRITSTNFGACSPATAVLVQKDVSTGASQIDTATLDVVVDANGLAAGAATLELFAADADFDEATVGGPLASRRGATLNSTVNLSNATPAGAVLTFPSTPAFVAYAEAARTGDGQASFFIQLSSCSFGVNVLDLEEKETGTAPSFLFLNPTAVTLQDASATPNNGSWILWLGVILLLVLTTVALRQNRRVRQVQRSE